MRTFEKEIIVVGGGMSGIAAAASAAREGAEVLLVEKHGFLGGMATAGLVNPFMAYATWKNENETDWSNIVNQGLFREIVDGLDNLGGLHINRMTFNDEILKIILDRLMKKYNVQVLFHSLVSSATRNENVIDDITVTNKSGYTKYKARYYVDTTGDGDLAALSGCDYHIGRVEDGLCQPMTLCFRVGNVDPTKYSPVFESENSVANEYGTDRIKCQNNVNKKYDEMKKMGKLRNPRGDVLTFNHMMDSIVHFNSTRIPGKSSINAEELSHAEMEGREQAYELYLFMKNNIEGFENSTLLMSAPHIGVRESRRIVGEYTITAEDLLNATKFEDSIARGTYPVDIHDPNGEGTIIQFIPCGDYYTIPYKALIPKGVDNLIVAGRPISSTHEAHSAYRVMPICTCIGEGAGIATGIANRNCRIYKDVKIKEIHSLMDKYGALY